MQELHKKGSTAECDHYRGLLISDHLGKVGATVVDGEMEARGSTTSYLPVAQCGAVQRRGTDLANHLVCTAFDVAAAKGMSIAVLFLDLAKAFDFVLREIVLGWPRFKDGEGLEYLCQLGLERERALVLAEEINEHTVLEELRVHPHLRELLTSLHTNSWF